METTGSRSLEQWLHHIESVHHRSIDMGLDRIGGVLSRLGLGPLPFPVITVAGTNGKGSTVAMLSSVLRVSGRRTAAYTSPHLTHYSERIVVDGVRISDRDLCRAFEHIEQVRNDTPLTYFEFGTAAAMWYFEQQGVDVAVMEVGMGGRLDAVNAVSAEVALVTNIALDHELWLGSDREAIGYEKAGIFRSRQRAVCADPHPPARLIEVAADLGTDLLLMKRDFGFRAAGEQWHWWGPDSERLTLPRPALAGREQVQNAAGAVMALRCFASADQIGVTELTAGLNRVHLRGRFQVVQLDVQVVLDVAHNPAAAQALRVNLAQLPPAAQTHAVCGMMRDKSFDRLAQIVDDCVDHWYLATIDDPRGATATQLQEQLGGEMARLFEDSVAAFEAARAAARPGHRIVVFGSFHTVGDILRHLQSRG